MNDLSDFYGPNAGYVWDLYERYQHDPDSVDAETRAFFANLPTDSFIRTTDDGRRTTESTPPGSGVKGPDAGFFGKVPPHKKPTAKSRSLQDDGPAEQSFPEPAGRPRFDAPHLKGSIKRADSVPTTQLPNDAATQAITVEKVVAAARTARFVREIGHLAARIDPLGSPAPGDPGLDPATHGLTREDLQALPASVVAGPLAEGAPNAWVALERLRAAYCGSIGYEDDHVQVGEERKWLRHAVETGRFFRGLGEIQQSLLARLTEVETFELFLKQHFGTDKWFSIQGNDMLIPMLDQVIEHAAAAGTREVVMGMAHRGRLNVLAHILGKPYTDILADFQSKKLDASAAVSGGDTEGWSGDVKYHLGASRTYTDSRVESMPITLQPNPSHLEYVNPVVTGRARAAQTSCDLPGEPVQDLKASLPLLIHGDASFPGQGIVAETLNLSQLHGYRVGGTLHIIVNNQVGFTTNPREGRSTLYASDLAKGFEIPIVHVNADDPIACIAVARMAWAYREEFGKDFLIDLVGYRRYGHNEGDEPAFTQPRMYQLIEAHPSVREIWARALEKGGIVKRERAEEMVASARKELEEAFNGRAQAESERPITSTSTITSTNQRALTALEAGQIPSSGEVHTAVPAANLSELNKELHRIPDGFAVNPKLERTFLSKRRTALGQAGGIQWAHAESLAFAAILADGTPIRFSGQDTQRGTFSQRHLVLYDPSTGQAHVPLQVIPQSRASFEVVNSPLSENAAVGFEYGYSMHATGALVLWEAQFGDFSNGAQVIIDQFMVSGNAKWRQTPSLVLLLPHGYEGQGPEHSSARLERFLQLAANENIRVVNCSTAAQYFHVLRRQAALLHTSPRPLVIMTPKSLLREPLASSSLSDLSEGRFEPVVDDPRMASARADRVTRLVLCSGKVSLDLVKHEQYETSERVAVARVEQLYPFPVAEVREVLARYRRLKEVVWVQEEPKNMGAWHFVARRIRELVERGMLQYVGRRESASPAEGNAMMHRLEQSRIVSEALSGAPETPEAKSRRSGMVHAR